MSFDVSAYVKKIVESKPAGGGNPIRDGKYVFAIKSLTIKPSDKKGPEVWFIAEFFVVSAAPVDVPPEFILPVGDKNHTPVTTPNTVGSDCSMVVDLNSQMGPANVKELAAADLGLKHDQINDENLSKWLSDNVEVPGGNPTWKATGLANPLQGRFLALTTRRSLTKTGKNAGKPGIRCNWDHLAQTPSERAAVRAMLQPKAA
jgi:hypothetical protein